MITIVTTLLNEHATIAVWWESLRQQTCVPDEFVFVDGGSTDGTWEWLQGIATTDAAKPAVRVFQHAGNIATGRNAAIGWARGDVIVVTDAGCIYDASWLECLVAPLIKKESVFSTTAFEPQLLVDDSFWLYLIAAATTPTKKEFIKDWLPSSRSVAFTKQLWQNVGGYPEWIPYTEDVLFDMRIATLGIKPFFVREPLVAWRPRLTLWRYMRQLYNYTRSDGHAKLFYARQVIRFFTYGGLIIFIGLSLFQSLWWFIFLAVSGSIYMYKFWRRFWSFSSTKHSMIRCFGMLVLPLVIAIGDVGKMVGWVVGVGERWRGKVVESSV